MTTTAREQFEQEALPYLDELYASALRLTHQKENAEDLISEVFSRAWKARDQFTPGTNRRAWLYKILTNTFINHYRRQQRAPVQIELDKPESPEDAGNGGGGSLYDRIADSRPLISPEQVVANRLLDEDLKRAIESLPEDFRMVVMLADVQSFSYQEIADMMEIPIGTVRSRLWRGRRLLQKILWDQALSTGVVGAKEPRP